MPTAHLEDRTRSVDWGIDPAGLEVGHREQIAFEVGGACAAEASGAAGLVAVDSAEVTSADSTVVDFDARTAGKERTDVSFKFQR